MPVQLEFFEGFKKYNVAYPSEPFAFGKSLCHWFPTRTRRAFVEVIKTLPEDAIYLELGSFLGAGSTLAALESHPTLLAYCVDLFHMQGVTANKFRLNNEATSAGEQCDYLQGKGTHLQHFLNNTWVHRSRVAAIQRQISADFLSQLYTMGVRPDLILVDDDHQQQPVLSRLRSIARYWPEAIVLLDDHTDKWNGVRMAVASAFDEGIYRQEDSKLLANRLMKLNGSYLKHVDARPDK